MLEKLLPFKEVFEVQLSAVGKIEFLVISDKLKNHEQRTAAANNMFVKLKEQDAFPCLRGWRNEVCSGQHVASFPGLHIQLLSLAKTGHARPGNEANIRWHHLLDVLLEIYLTLAPFVRCTIRNLPLLYLLLACSCIYALFSTLSLSKEKQGPCILSGPLLWLVIRLYAVQWMLYILQSVLHKVGLEFRYCSRSLLCTTH